MKKKKNCHNPYFNRWFSAITAIITLSSVYKSHNPYFNRWFSAIECAEFILSEQRCHNPYFNRWFSAIMFYVESFKQAVSQSLF